MSESHVSGLYPACPAACKPTLSVARPCHPVCDVGGTGSEALGAARPRGPVCDDGGSGRRQALTDSDIVGASLH